MHREYLDVRGRLAQWLKLALVSDDGCGISADIDRQLPGQYVWRVYRAGMDMLI